MIHNYLNSIYTSLVSDYEQIILNNEKILNELTKYIILKPYYNYKQAGGTFEQQQDNVKKLVDNAINDLVKKCGNNADVDKLVKIVRSLLTYIDQLYNLTKDINVIAVREQLTELEKMLLSLS